ncbi:MAG: glycosyltransferase family 2 protein [Acidobacteriota bacterium]|nr:glycosyltransferase family 2 protein [Acidobacteriota bacterium]
MKISICIPTYNRAAHLNNCLHSILANRSRSATEFEVCVSDNCSTDGTAEVVRAAQTSLAIKYQRNPSNLGLARNFLHAVAMAEGEFVWLLGDDDLLLPYALEELSELIRQHPSVEFFYINSFHLTAQHVASFPQPFDTANLPVNMIPFSTRTRSGEVGFLDLVDPRISFDFLGGMFLSVFRRGKWNEHVGALDEAAMSDPRMFSHFDNTFPHVKIFSRAFADSNAFFHAKPLSVCLTGAREWAPMYPFIHSVRLVQALDEYRKNGLPYLRYLRCKNFALNNFLPDLGFMLKHRESSGYVYVKPWRLLLGNALYPNVYLSVVWFCLRKIRLGLGKIALRFHEDQVPLQ